MGASPMELVLMELRCSAIDMISILKTTSRNHVFQTEEEENAYKLEKQNHLKNIHVVFYLEGDKEDKAAKAAQLSFEKYCSVSKTLEPTATIHYRVVLNGSSQPKGEPVIVNETILIINFPISASFGRVGDIILTMNNSEFGFETQAIRNQLERTQYLEHSVPLYLTSSI
jgi:putative redox protein